MLRQIGKHPPLKLKSAIDIDQQIMNISTKWWRRRWSLEIQTERIAPAVYHFCLKKLMALLFSMMCSSTARDTATERIWRRRPQTRHTRMAPLRINKSKCSINWKTRHTIFRKMHFWNIPACIQTIPTPFPNVSKYTQDMKMYTKIYKIPSGGEAAPPGPAPRGPAAAWYFVYLGICLYILDIFGYISIYVWYIFDICWYSSKWNFLEFSGSIFQVTGEPISCYDFRQKWLCSVYAWSASR